MEKVVEFQAIRQLNNPIFEEGGAYGELAVGKDLLILGKTKYHEMKRKVKK